MTRNTVAILLLSFTTLAAAVCSAQTTTNATPYRGTRVKVDFRQARGTPKAPGSFRPASSQGAWVLDKAGPNEKVWKRVSTNEVSGSFRSVAGEQRGSPRIVQIATGMNYWNGQAWVPSEPAFELVGGAFARNGSSTKCGWLRIT